MSRYSSWSMHRLIQTLRTMIRTDFGGHEPLRVAKRKTKGLSPAEAYLAGANDTRRGIAERVANFTTELSARVNGR